MNWCRFHHSTPFDLDRRGLSLAAKWLFVCSFNWCSRQESDGRFDKGAELRSIIAEANVPPKAAKELLDAGMWADCGDRYEVKHYLRYQNSNEQIEAQRDRWRRNKKRKDSTEESTEESAVASCVDSPASEKRREEKRREVSTEALGIQDLGGAGGETGANGALPVGSGDFLRSVSTIPETEADRARKAELRGQLERLKRGGSR